MDREDLSKKYWNYYLMLENRFMKSLEYVELNPKNYETFSIFYAHQIQSIGAELDVFFKEFCQFSTADTKTIKDYADYILSNDPDIKTKELVLQEYNIIIKPFKTWNQNQPAKSLVWWTAFTDIKHNRYDKLEQANLKNVLNILGALFLLEMVYLKQITDGTTEIDIFDKQSQLFGIKGWSTKAIALDRGIGIISEK